MKSARPRRIHSQSFLLLQKSSYHCPWEEKEVNFLIPWDSFQTSMPPSSCNTPSDVRAIDRLLMGVTGTLPTEHTLTHHYHPPQVLPFSWMIWSLQYMVKTNCQTTGKKTIQSIILGNWLVFWINKAINALRTLYTRIYSKWIRGLNITK